MAAHHPDQAYPSLDTNRNLQPQAQINYEYHDAAAVRQNAEDAAYQNKNYEANFMSGPPKGTRPVKLERLSTEEEAAKFQLSHVKGSYFHCLIAMQVLAAVLTGLAIGLVSYIRYESGLVLLEDITYVLFSLVGLASIMVGIFVLCFRKRTLVGIYLFLEVAFFLLFFALFYKLTVQGEIRTIKDSGDLNGLVWGFIAVIMARITLFMFQLTVMLFRLKKW